MICEYFEPEGAGGASTTLPALVKELRAQAPDLEIDVVTSRNLYHGDRTTHLPASAEWESAQIYRVASPHSGGQGLVKRLISGVFFTRAALARATSLPRPDLVLISTAPPTAPIAARVLSRRRKVPYLYLLYDIYPDVAVELGMLPRYSLTARMCFALQRSWLCGAAAVVVIGRCMRERLLNHYRLSPARITTIPCFADAREITPRSRDTAFRARHNLHGFVLLYAGNLGRLHNFDLVLDAAQHLQPLRPEITFVIVGEGPKREDIARRIADDALTNVRLLPFVPHHELPDLLASADVSLVTLEPGMEGISVPSKLYSILASGRPVLAITSPASEVARVVQEAECGEQIDHADLPRLIDTLTRMADTPEWVERMGRNARSVLETQYSLSSAAAQFYTLFNRLTAREPCADGVAVLDD